MWEPPHLLIAWRTGRVSCPQSCTQTCPHGKTYECQREPISLLLGVLVRGGGWTHARQCHFHRQGATAFSSRWFAASRLPHSHSRAETELAANSFQLLGLQEELPFPLKPLLKHVSPLLCGAISLYPPSLASFVGFGISRRPSTPPSKHLLVIKMQLRIVHFAWYIIIPR